MPNLPRTALTWSEPHQHYELHTQEDATSCFSEQDGRAFSVWLETHSSFAFVGKFGRLSVLKEARVRGNGYWYAYRKQGQHTRKLYLGPSSQVTFARLEELARALASTPHAPSRAQLVSAHTIPLLSTKLVSPRLPGFLVERPRLLRDLDAAWAHPLTLVSSSAGSGKTTLLSAWASRQENSVSWLSLDNLDTDPTRFWTACIAALRRCQPTLGAEAFALLHSPQSPPLSTILVMLLNEMVLLQQEILLILDDFHVISDQAIHDSLGFLLEHLPSNFHLILATRSDPAFSLATWRVRGQLLEIRAGELRFTEQEAASFLVQGMNLPLSESEVATLTERTEGWIAGLQLAALSLSKHQNPSRAASDFGGSHRYLLDYVQQDILVGLSVGLQDFVLQTSVVTRMNAEICQALTVGATHEVCQQMLEEIERANLFVVPLDAQRQWYRYHDLFREALQARLQASQPELVPILHVRAARWYETQGEFREAIAHALAAPDFSYAADLIERAAPHFLLSGEARTVLTWLLSLPDTTLRAHLHLAFSAALRFIDSINLSNERLYTSIVAQVERTFTRLEEILLAAQELSLSQAEEAWIGRRLRLLRVLIELRAINKRGDTERLWQLSQELDALPEDEEASWNLIPLSIAFWLTSVHQGDGARLIQRLCVAKQQMMEAKDFLMAVRVMTWLAVASTQAPQLQRAQRECLEALALIKQIGVRTPWERHLYYSLFNISYAQNRLEEAANWLKLLRQNARDWQPMRQMQQLVMGEIFSARLALAKGDLPAAEEAQHSLNRLQEQGVLPHHSSWITALRVQCWLAEGNLIQVRTWVARTVFSEETWHPLRRWELLMLVRVYLYQHMFAQALETLSRFSQYFDQPGISDTALEWMALSVVALQRSEKIEQARSGAARLLAIAAPEGYVRLPLDMGEPLMKEVLEIWLHAHPEENSQANGEGPSRSAALRMLALLEQSPQKSGAATVPEQSAVRHTLLEPLSQRERQVLQLLVAGQTYAEMARELIVSPHTIKTQVGSIYRKLGVSRRAEAIAAASRLHLL